MIALLTLAALWLGFSRRANARTFGLAIGLFLACLAIQTFYLAVWPVNSDEPAASDYWLLAFAVFLVWLVAVWLGDLLGRRRKQHRA